MKSEVFKKMLHLNNQFHSYYFISKLLNSKPIISPESIL